MKLNELHGCITNLIDPYTWVMAWQWHHLRLTCYRW